MAFTLTGTVTNKTSSLGGTLRVKRTGRRNVKQRGRAERMRRRCVYPSVEETLDLVSLRNTQTGSVVQRESYSRSDEILKRRRRVQPQGRWAVEEHHLSQDADPVERNITAVALLWSVGRNHAAGQQQAGVSAIKSGPVWVSWCWSGSAVVALLLKHNLVMILQNLLSERGSSWIKLCSGRPDRFPALTK